MVGHKHQSEYENNALGFLYTIQMHHIMATHIQCHNLLQFLFIPWSSNWMKCEAAILWCTYNSPTHKSHMLPYKIHAQWPHDFFTIV